MQQQYMPLNEGPTPVAETPEPIVIEKVVYAPNTSQNELAYRIGGYFLQHQATFDYYDRMYKILAIPTLIVTSCVPVLEVIMPDTKL